MVERFPLNKRYFNGTPSPVFVGENPKDCECNQDFFAGNDIRSFDSAQGLSESTK